MYLFLLLAIPLVWFVVAKFWLHNTITIMEMVVSIVVTCFITAVVYFCSTYINMLDVATINGEVISKTKEKVSCSHLYPCRPRTVKCGSSTCIRYDTCYSHLYDVNWVVKSNVGSVKIARVDSQGKTEPPRWTSVKIGEYFSRVENYVNYIKAAPNSLFNRMVANQYLERVPDYPQAIYLDFKMDRLVTDGVEVPNEREWNTALGELLKVLGPKKQVNVVLLFTSVTDENYAEAVAYKWLGGKKNDAVIIVGVDGYPKIKWVRVLAYSQQSIFQVKLRDALMAQKELEVVATSKIIEETIGAFYTRKEMADFKYLENEVEPALWVLLLSLFTNVIFCVTLTLLAHKWGWFK